MTTTTITPLPVSALTWATKAGKAKAAHTPSAQSRAPASVRLPEADQRTLDQLVSGQYRPFLRDAIAALSQGHKLALNAHLSRELSRDIDGVQYTAVVDVDSILSKDSQVKANKELTVAFARFMSAPRAVIKKVEQDKPLAKGAQYLTRIAGQWLDSLAITEAMGQAGMTGTLTIEAASEAAATLLAAQIRNGRVLKADTTEAEAIAHLDKIINEANSADAELIPCYQ